MRKALEYEPLGDIGGSLVFGAYYSRPVAEGVCEALLNLPPEFPRPFEFARDDDTPAQIKLAAALAREDDSARLGYLFWLGKQVRGPSRELVEALARQATRADLSFAEGRARCRVLAELGAESGAAAPILAERYKATQNFGEEEWLRQTLVEIGPLGHVALVRVAASPGREGLRFAIVEDLQRKGRYVRSLPNILVLFRDKSVDAQNLVEVLEMLDPTFTQTEQVLDDWAKLPELHPTRILAGEVEQAIHQAREKTEAP